MISSITTRINFYLNEYKDLSIEKIKYTTLDVNNNTITVDGSTKYESKLAHIKFDKILDCEYITEPIPDDGDDPHKIATEEDIDKIIESIENDNASIATEDQINNLIKE